MIRKKIKAFTLVELIIVIVILSILATISFVSISGYVKNSKYTSNDVTLRNIESGIINQYTKTSFLPSPDGEVFTGTFDVNGLQKNILFSGVVGDGISRFSGMYSIPKNAVNGESFYYGVSANKKFFQLGVLQPHLMGNLIHSSYANSEIMKISGNYSYPLVLGNNIVNVPSLIVESSSGGNLSNTSSFFIDNQPKGVSTSTALRTITTKEGITLTGIVLEDWKTQSGIISNALGFSQEESGVRIYGATKYYKEILEGKSQQGFVSTEGPSIQSPIFTASTPIGETQTINGTKVVFAGSQSGTLYMTHPSCGNVSGTGAFRMDCSGSGCLKGYFTEAKNGNYSNWNLNCDGSVGELTTRWDGGFGSFNCGGDNIICNSLSDGRQNTLDIVSEYEARGNYSTSAHFCKNLRIGGYEDWYLPSRNELLHFYNNRNTIGGFTTGTYTSSTESTANIGDLIRVSMSGGGVSGTYKYSHLFTRCIRKVNN